MPILETHQLLWPDEAACAAFANHLADRLAKAPGLIDTSIELHGALGAGKTSFVRHLLRALGVTGRIKSPSYAVLESYQLPRGDEVHHFDFYRFADPREWEDAGFRELFAAPGLKLSEWAEKAAGMLPVADLQIALHVGDDDSRVVTLTAGTARGVAILESLDA